MKCYMDHAATTPVDKEVVNVMLPYFSEKFGNSSSLHQWGQEAKEALESARDECAKLIGADAKEIVFTSGGSESDNLALKGVLGANPKKNHIVTSAIEHHAIHTTSKELEKEGFKVTFVPVDKYGMVSVSDVSNAITEKTAIVSIMHANNEIGTIQPIEEIGKVCKQKGVKFHTDAVQSVGKIPVDVEKLNVDLLSASGHKIYGPKGVGFLYIKRGTKVKALIQGGGHEFGLRAGTENISGIVGLGKACEIARKGMVKEGERLTKLSKYLVDKMMGEIGDSYLNGHPTKRIPGTNNFRFDYIEGEALILHMDMKGIAASTGSACSTKSLEPSYVLTSLGLEHVQAHGSLRLSLGKINNKEQVDYVVESVKEIVENLRTISPLRKR
ncbi:MAG: cysteine desulfurase NifS [Candidatus Woesearchaeota archaeon]|nr:cysteine desulfurase NifS [Candidatus Woesearchaeota archaeon]MDP7323849.1 cysteine desulfurase NifS [Candidatus Woesearchaeota archaeon]